MLFSWGFVHRSDRLHCRFGPPEISSLGNSTSHDIFLVVLFHLCHRCHVTHSRCSIQVVYHSTVLFRRRSNRQLYHCTGDLPFSTTVSVLRISARLCGQFDRFSSGRVGSLDRVTCASKSIGVEDRFCLYHHGSSGVVSQRRGCLRGFFYGWQNCKHCRIRISVYWITVQFAGVTSCDISRRSVSGCHSRFQKSEFLNKYFPILTQEVVFRFVLLSITCEASSSRTYFCFLSWQLCTTSECGNPNTACRRHVLLAPTIDVGIFLWNQWRYRAIFPYLCTWNSIVEGFPLFHLLAFG